MENHKAVGNSREAREVNQVLDACRTILDNKYRDIFEKDNFVTAEKLKTLISAFQQIIPCYLNYLEIL